MLQWHQKYTAFVLVIVLVALSAIVSNFTWVFGNLTW